MKYFVLLMFLFLINKSCFSQILELDIEKAISIAKVNSSDYKRLRNDSILNELNQELFRIKTLPKVNFKATVPNLSNSITSITKSDGSDSYVDRFVVHSTASFSASQYVPFSGGTITLSSSLNGLYNILPAKSYSFNLNLVNFAYSQELNGFNEYRWEKRLFKKQQQINRITSLRGLEAINQKVIELFFDCYIEQSQHILYSELLNLTKLSLDKAEKKFEERQILEDDLIDAQIEYKQSLSSYIDSSALKSKEQSLKNYLQIPSETSLCLNPADSSLIPLEFLFDKKNIIERALIYYVEPQNEYDRLEKQKAMLELNASSGATFEVSLNGGANSSSTSIPSILNDVNRQFSVLLSMSVPLLDWGERKLKKKISNIEYDEIILQQKDKKESSLVDLEKEIESITILYRDLKLEKELLLLEKRRLKLIQANLEAGKVDVEKLEKARLEILKTNLSVNKKNKNLLLLIYKYRSIAFWDLIKNKSIYE